MVRRSNVILFLSFLVLISPIALASSTYTIAVSGSVDTPDRTVTVDGSDYEITAVATADLGDTLSVSTSGPEKIYNVLIYNSEEDIVASKSARGDETVSFSLSDINYAAGTYTIAIDDGAIRAIHPLVIRGYSVTVDAPPQVAEDDTIDVSVSIAHVAGDQQVDDVEIIIANEDVDLQKSAIEQSDGVYSATFDAAELTTGEYMLYAAVRGTEEAFGRNELLGISETHTLEISEPAKETTQGEAPDDSNSGSQNTPKPTAVEPTQTVTLTETIETTSPSIETTPSPTSTDESVQTTRKSTESEGNVITPSTETPTPPSETPGQPGFGFVLTLLTLMAVALLGYRRSV